MKLPPKRALALGAALAAMIAGCSSTDRGSIPIGNALGPVSGPGAPDLGLGMSDANIGEPILYALWHPYIHGTSVVHFKRVEVVGLPKEFVIDSVFALWGAPTAVFKGWDAAPVQSARTAIDGLVLDPSCRPTSHCGPLAPPPVGARPQNYVLMFQAHITRPGHYATKALRIVYEVDGQQYQQTFPHLTIDANSGTQTPAAATAPAAT